MKLIAYTDGGARGNPGHAAFAVVVTDARGDVLQEFARYLGVKTNNEAEYHGAIAGLIAAAEAGADEVEVVMDSELVVKQINGIYACRAPNLLPLLAQARDLMRGFRRAEFRNVRRSDPMVSRADALLNKEMDARASEKE